MGNGLDTRRFEYKDEKSLKFWEITVSGASFTVCYGKIGTDGQTQVKDFADAATAEKQAQKLIAEKTGKGYQEAGADTKRSTIKPVAKGAVKSKSANSQVQKATNNDAKRLTNPDSTVVEWQPNLSADRRLAGPYPKVLDLRTYSTLPHAEDFQDEQPDIKISDDDGLEILNFPCDAIWYNFAIIENLPNLVELNVLTSEFSFGKTLQWLICRNLPKLKKIRIDSNLVWLEIRNVAALDRIDVSRSPKLDYFVIEGASNLKKLSINKCVKLKDVVGLSVEEKERLGVTVSISEMQKKSRLDGKIYSNMTYTDVEYVMKVINEGMKACARKGFYPFSDDPLRGPCDGKEYDPKYSKHGFNLLQPLETVYTGGTGEIYGYASLIHCFWWDDIKQDIQQRTGNSSQEDCLEYMLHWESMGYVSDTGGDLSLEEILGLFKREYEAGYDVLPYRKIYLSSAIPKENQGEYRDELAKFGFISEPELNEHIDLVVVVAEDPDEDSDFESARDLGLNIVSKNNLGELLQSLRLVHSVAHERRS